MKKTKWFHKQRTSVLFLSGALLLLLFIATARYTYSALTDRDSKDNHFRLSDVKGMVEEEFVAPEEFEADRPYRKKVTVKNTGNSVVFVRVLALPSLTKTLANGTVILLPSSTGTASPVLTIDYNLNDWIQGEDGYFYYKKGLKANENTKSLFTTVTMNSAAIDETYQGAKLTFEIKSEVIVATKYAYRDAWWSGAVPTSTELKKVDTLLNSQVID